MSLKRNYGENQDDSENLDFDFETETEREEQVAQELREKRRKRLQALASSSSSSSTQQQIQVVSNIRAPVQRETVTKSDSTSPYNNNFHVWNHIHKDKVDEGRLSLDIFATTEETPCIDTNTNPISNVVKNITAARANAQDMDDAEGYYKASIGEVLCLTRNDNETQKDTQLHFKVLGIIGKGVFSTVLKCVRILPELQTSTDLGFGPDVVAVKLIRNNEIMAKAALKEAKILRVLRFSQQNKKHRDESNKQQNYNIVKMLEWQDFFPPKEVGEKEKEEAASTHVPLLDYNFHSVLLFEHLSINLRELLSKFGKNVGINLTAVRSYAKQLLLALQHLQSLGIIHADIKPDNILVSQNFQIVKLADFGSAFFQADPLEKEILTPYLVSRFYRAPEIILGLDYDLVIDVWSLGVTLAELFTGQVLFPGRSNNDMLSKLMETLGPFSHKMIKRHILSYTGKFNRAPHFEEMASGGAYSFRKQDVDEVTGRPRIRIVTLGEGNTNHSNLAQILLRAKSQSDSRVHVLQFADLLHRFLALDPSKRLQLDVGLQHDFFHKFKAGQS